MTSDFPAAEEFGEGVGSAGFVKLEPEFEFIQKNKILVLKIKS